MQYLFQKKIQPFTSGSSSTYFNITRLQFHVLATFFHFEIIIDEMKQVSIKVRLSGATVGGNMWKVEIIHFATYVM